MTRTVPTRTPLACLAAAVALVCAAPQPAAAKDASLTGFDVLCRPGRTVALRAKLESSGVMGINPDVEGESLDFFLIARDGKDVEPHKYLGSGKTDDDGVAKIEWIAKDAAAYQIEARIRKGSDYMGLPARIRVAAPPPEQTIVLVQLDETVSLATNVKMFRGTENEKIAAVEGAREMLQLLSGPYQLVYLTDLEVAFTSKFKDWLQLRKLPPAPVIFWELFERSLSHETYMRKLIAKLRQDFPKIEVGVGGSASDGKVFVESGMAGVVITGEPGDLAPAVIPAANWRHVLLHVTLLHKAELLLAQAVEGDAAARAEALAELSQLGPEGVGYVHRFKQAADIDRATLAQLVAAKLKAIEAFSGSLDTSSPNAALRSLLAAWRYGEPAAVIPLYQERDLGEQSTIPSFHRVETISRTEPEPGKVVFSVRLIGEETVERELVFVRLDDPERWRLQVQGF